MKHHDQKPSWGRKGLLGLHFHIDGYHWRKSGTQTGQYPWGRRGHRNHRWVLGTGLLLMACTAFFLSFLKNFIDSLGVSHHTFCPPPGTPISFPNPCCDHQKRKTKYACNQANQSKNNKNPFATSFLSLHHLFICPGGTGGFCVS